MARDVLFQETPEQDFYALENQDGATRDADWEAVEEYLEAMFDDPDQFVILTPPAAQNGVRFAQARRQEEQIEVEIALQEEGGVRLYYKMVSPCQCRRIFLDYFRGAFFPDRAEYRPVEFL